MISGTHAILYTTDADADRAFFRDVLRFPHVDAGGGWLIFRLPPAELGVHPVEPGAASTPEGGGSRAPIGPGSHEVYFTCDDVHATVRELQARGVLFTADVHDAGWGLLTRFRLPGGSEIGLYQPRHACPPK